VAWERKNPKESPCVVLFSPELVRWLKNLVLFISSVPFCTRHDVLNEHKVNSAMHVGYWRACFLVEQLYSFKRGICLLQEIVPFYVEHTCCIVNVITILQFFFGWWILSTFNFTAVKRWIWEKNLILNKFEFLFIVFHFPFVSSKK
jgi:hypothetical protein